MANELKHGTVGTELTQAEWESITAHVLDAQATGDTIYASSATQLRRLGIGASNTVLAVSGGIPAWVAGPTFGATTTIQGNLVIDLGGQTLTLTHGIAASHQLTFPDPLGNDSFVYLALAQTLSSKTLNAPVMQGTWTASGTVTLPAVTLGGAITANAQDITGVGNLTVNTYKQSGNANMVFYLDGDAAAGKLLTLGTTNLAGGGITRLAFSTFVDIGVATWTNVYHTGIKHGLAGTATGAFTMDGATSGVVTVTVSAVAGTWTMTLPTGVAGVGGYQLADAAGNGVCSWTAAGCRREWKNPLGLEYSVSPSQALDRILGTMVYPFRFKKGFGTGDYETVYQGVYADEAPWAMHFQGSILNPISTFGHTVLAIQALEGQILNLRQEVASLRQSMIGKGNT